MSNLLKLIVVAMGLSGCSAVQSSYVAKTYDTQGNGVVKRIAVLGWAANSSPKLADTVALVAADLVKLRTNYLVMAAQPLTKTWGGNCKTVEGVLIARVLDVQRMPSKVRLTIAMELYACSDGLLIWRTVGAAQSPSMDKDLMQFVSVYEHQLGPEAQIWAAPAFILMQDLVDSLPNPELTDDELFEKLELG